jgi:linoleoyl-CoA desaturase
LSIATDPDADRPSPSDSAQRRLRFTGDNSFQHELRRRVSAHLRAIGRPERGGGRMHAKTALILASFACSYSLLVFVAAAWWQALPLAIVLALSTVAIGFNIMHDANHGAYSNHRWLNRAMGMSLDMVGGSSHFWQWKHNVFHHTFVNVVGYDTDINLVGLGRLTPHHPHLWFHSWQHLYVWFLYGAMVVKWHLYDDFRLALTGRMAQHTVPRPSGSQWLVFLGGKLVFISLAFVIPLLLHPAWAVAATYLVVAVVVGIVLAVVFQLAHCVEAADFPTELGAGRMATAWAVHQVETSVDFARDSGAACWLLGGLNFQIEHHLFPRICHVNYPAIAPLVEQTCREFGVKYKYNQTFLSALRSHVAWLRTMGRAPLEAR